MRERFRSRGDGEQLLQVAENGLTRMANAGWALKEKEKEMGQETAQSRTGARMKKRMASFGRAAECFQGGKWIANLKSGGRKKRGDEEASPFIAALLALPSEIHILILSALGISDLLSLRLTSRRLNSLVSRCGPALVRVWVKCRLGSLHVKLYPPPAPDEAQFQYLLAMRRRHIAAVRLTRELADYILRDTFKPSTTDSSGSNPPSPRQQLWTSVYDTMLPLAFVVGYLLDSHRRVILERDLGRIRPRCHVGYDICTTPGIPDEEACIFKRVDHLLRLHYFYMYSFIIQVLKRKLRPPTRTSSSLGMLVVRGWTGPPACKEDIAFVLVLGGIGQVAKLLACRTYNERRRLLHTFITRLSPHENRDWRAHWRDLGVCSPALLDDIPCASIGVTQLDEIFEPLMERLMQPSSREFTERQRLQYEEVRRSRDYVNAIMGYGVLGRARGRGSDGDDSDEEVELEHEEI